MHTAASPADTAAAFLGATRRSGEEPNFKLGIESRQIEAVAEQLRALMSDLLQTERAADETEEASPLYADNHIKMRNSLMEGRAVRQLSILGWMHNLRATLSELITIDPARRALCSFATSHWQPTSQAGALSTPATKGGSGTGKDSKGGNGQ